MSIERAGRSDGRTVYVVRWYESGRGSARRKRTFDRRRDAELFEASLRRARQLGQLASEVIGSNLLLEEFLVEWWDTYAVTHLRPNTLATYTTLLDNWIVPYLGRKRLREITRQTIDAYIARIRADGAGAPTVNRALGVLQGVFHRAVEWRRLGWNPVVGTRRISHTRSATIDARTPETVEAIRAHLGPQDAALVSVLAYEGLRPGEAYALTWSDVLDDRSRRRKRLRIHAAISAGELSTTKSQRAREPELFAPVARELVALHLAQGRPAGDQLVFPDSAGGRLRRQNWRRRVWIPALEAARVPYFRSYDLRHTCATLLLYEGRTLNEVAEHLGHADPGFTARTYTHVMRDASKRRRITINEAIRRARVAASRRPLVAPSAANSDCRRNSSDKKSLQRKEADAGTRTPDPIITREPEEGNRGPSEGGEGRKRPARCPHCGGRLEPEGDPQGPGDVRGGYAAEPADWPGADVQDGAA
jgi:integrase